MSVSLIFGLIVIFVVLYILAKLSKLLGLVIIGLVLAWLFFHPTGAHWRHQLPFSIGARSTLSYADPVFAV